MADIIFAQNRFGLGPRGDRLLQGDGRDWLMSQIASGPPPVVVPQPSRAEIANLVETYFTTQLAFKKRQAAPDPMGNSAMTNAAMSGSSSEEASYRTAVQALRQNYNQLVKTRVENALETPSPFLEHMVHFWSNHFSVSAKNNNSLAFIGSLEGDAIRPNVLGSFRDLLQSVEHHPSMLFYLDQPSSIGPQSPAAIRAQGDGKTRGLNENLAREILELHTLGVRSGYTQNDVSEFARALTGWHIVVPRHAAEVIAGGQIGTFAFTNNTHQPGARTIMGRQFADNGEGQAEAVLDMLAVHPQTARHIATKLARHFAADDPPPAMIARLERAFISSRGDLATVYRALVASPEAWNPATAKFRTPWEWSIAGLRAVAAPPAVADSAASLLNDLGQQTWTPPSPAGWDDVASAWAGPDALYRRVEVAAKIAGSLNETADARALARAALGGRLSDRTATAIARAESPKSALGLLLACPEMMRR